MANVINLPRDERASTIGEGLGGILNAYMAQQQKKQQEEETTNYVAELIKTKQAEDEKALATGGIPDHNVGMLVPKPKHIDVATQVGLVNQVFKPPTKTEAPDLISYFKPPESGQKGAVPELVAELPKNKARPKGTYTREEIASFLQFPPSERAKPTEKELVLGSELRQFKDAFKGVDKQTAIDRVRLYQSGENDLQNSITQSLGVFNKDTNRYEINQPELVRKVPRIQNEVKRLMYTGEVKDWQEGLLKAYDKFGVEPPMKPEIPPPAKPKELSIADRIKNLFSAKETTPPPAATAAPQTTTQAAAQGTQVAPISENTTTFGAIGGQEIKVPSNLRTAKEIHTYMMQTYELDPQTALQLINRHAGKP